MYRNIEKYEFDLERLLDFSTLEEGRKNHIKAIGISKKSITPLRLNISAEYCDRIMKKLERLRFHLAMLRIESTREILIEKIYM